MATGPLELLQLNKNRAKRNLSAGVFTVQMDIPGGGKLTDGSYVIGRIEGNIAITRVLIGVSTSFNGTLPLLDFADNVGNTYFQDLDISVTGLTESALTANSDNGGTPAFKNPLYSKGVVEFTADIDTSGGTLGGFYIVVDYVQLDTVTGKHTK